MSEKPAKIMERFVDLVTEEKERRFQELTPEEIDKLPEMLQSVCKALDGKLPMVFQVHYRLQKMIEERIASGEIAIDVNGHYKDGSLITDHPWRDPMTLADWFNDEVGVMTWRWDDEEFEKISQLIASPKKDEWVMFRKGSSLQQCPLCGKDTAWETNGFVIRVVDDCPYPEGAVYSWELNVPSGKLVIANDFRDKFTIIDDYNVNALEGCIQTTFGYAEVGMSHAYVGNSCPGVHKKNEKEFIIGSYWEEDDDDVDEKYKSDLGSEFNGTERVASICTDLWWYSIVDYNQFVERYGVPHEQAHLDIVDCEPGVYEFLHVGNVLDTEKNPSIYTYFHKVRDPDPVIDYRDSFNSLNVTAEQCLHNILKDYYMGSDNLYSAISTMMCCYGTGSECHPNGFFYSSYNKDLTNEEPEIEIPHQLGEHDWYPICEKYSPVCIIARGDVKANESFIRLAFNVLHSIIQSPPEDMHHGESSIKLALKLLKELYKREKALAPEYIEVLLQTE